MSTVASDADGVLTTDKLLTDKQVADILGITTGALANWRSTRRYRLSFIKVGRHVRYRLSDVMAWLDQRTQTCES